MKISSILFLTLLSGANASSLRGEAIEEGPIDQLACTIKGGTSQDTCDDTKSEDGSECVWCSFAAYGVCVSDSIASEMEQTIPGIDCDDSGGSDDDGAADDDAADDDAANDDASGDGYWDCIKNYKTSQTCTSAGCVWCDNKGGYGVCMDTDEAASFENSDWYSCAMPSLPGVDSQSLPVNDPSDPTCVAATIGGDQACKTTQDSEGKACDWCSFQGYDFCLNGDQAEFAEQIGASCGDSVNKETNAAKDLINKLADPSDPTCLAATIGGDESTCEGTSDVDGNPCDWCSFQGYDMCLNGDQAEIAEQIGASCGDSVNKEMKTAKDLINKLADPSDPACLAATIGGDESTCEGTSDVDGNPCDWCSFQGYDMCLNGDQAEIAEQIGASCGDSVNKETNAAKDLINKLADPSDPACLAVTIGGDESTCEETLDVDGNPCDWCSFQGYDMCLNGDQAEIAEQIGASCNEENIVEVPSEMVSDPSDPTCLAVTIGGDESACRATTDVDGKSCEWCSFQTYEFCLSVDQADIVGQYGASCNEEAVVDQPKEDLSDPNDPSCLVATLDGDESTCKAAMDSDGKPCDWCSFQSFEFCLNDDQAAVVEQFGASCGDDRDRTADDISVSIA